MIKGGDLVCWNKEWCWRGGREPSGRKPWYRIILGLPRSVLGPVEAWEDARKDIRLISSSWGGSQGPTIGMYLLRPRESMREIGQRDLNSCLKQPWGQGSAVKICMAFYWLLPDLAICQTRKHKDLRCYFFLLSLTWIPKCSWGSGERVSRKGAVPEPLHHCKFQPETGARWLRG